MCSFFFAVACVARKVAAEDKAGPAARAAPTAAARAVPVRPDQGFE